jgi:GT2 family glycosyltransferase
MKVSIITPWHNCPELIPAYESAVQGAEVIVIDNASDKDTAIALREMVDRLHGVYIRNDKNKGYAEANNQGLMQAHGEIVVFLNSDIIAERGWLDALAKLERGSLYAPHMGMRYVGGYGLHYLEGWCLIGYTDEVRKLGGWNADAFPAMYWEDNELCWRASRAGMGLREIRLSVRHLERYTTERTPGATDASNANRAVFERLVMEAQR